MTEVVSFQARLFSFKKMPDAVFPVHRAFLIYSIFYKKVYADWNALNRLLLSL